MNSLSLASLLLSFVLAFALVIFALRGAAGKRRMSPLGVLFVSGGLVWAVIPGIGYVYDQFAPHEISQAGLLEYWTITNHFGRHAWFWISDGVFWMLAFLAFRRLGLRRLIGFLIAFVIVGDVYPIFQAMSAFLLLKVQEPAYGMPPFSEYLAQFLRLRSEGIQMWIWIASTLMLFLITARWSRIESLEKQSSAARTAGIGGMFMSKRENQSTRLLCASVLFHSGARRTLLNWLKDKNRAVALELGVDLELAARVARFAGKRQRKATWIYFGLLCASLVAALVNPLLAILGVIASALVFFLRTKEERDKFAPMFWSDNFKASSAPSL